MQQHAECVLVLAVSQFGAGALRDLLESAQALPWPGCSPHHSDQNSIGYGFNVPVSYISGSPGVAFSQTSSIERLRE